MLKFKVIAKKNPISKQTAYYAQKVDTSRVSFDQICDRVAHASTATRADAKAVIDEFCHQALEVLLDGKSVSLGDLGSLHTTLKNKKNGAPSADKFETSMIEKAMVRWLRPTKMRREFTPGIGSVRFQRVDTPTADNNG